MYNWRALQEYDIPARENYSNLQYFSLFYIMEASVESAKWVC